MTETKLELVDNLEYHTLDDMIADVLPHDTYIDAKGRAYKVTGAGIFEIIAIIKEYPAAKAFMNNMIDVMLASKPDDDVHELLARFNSRTIVDLLVDVGPEAAAALIAICFNKGDRSKEAGIKRLPTSEIVRMLTAAANATFGGKAPDAFFIELLTTYQNLGIKNRDQKAKKPPASKANRQASKTSKRAA